MRLRRVMPCALGLLAWGGLWVRLHQRSPAALQWSKSILPEGFSNQLWVREGGNGPGMILLLHGLGGSGRTWSGRFDRLARSRRVVVPDLLGFGRSLDPARSAFALSDHRSALEALLDSIPDHSDPVTIGAHSFGAAVALELAAARTEVDAVVLFGAPITEAGDSFVAHVSPMARWFGVDTMAARVACRLSCAHRTLSGVIVSALQPSLPVPVARDVALHSWPAYRAAVDALAQFDWTDLVDRVSEREVQVVVVSGRDDPVPDLAMIDRLVEPWPTASHLRIDGGHRLPLDRPDECVRLISDATQVALARR